MLQRRMPPGLSLQEVPAEPGRTPLSQLQGAAGVVYLTMEPQSPSPPLTALVPWHAATTGPSHQPCSQPTPTQTGTAPCGVSPPKWPLAGCSGLVAGRPWGHGGIMALTGGTGWGCCSLAWPWQVLGMAFSSCFLFVCSFMKNYTIR